MCSPILLLNQGKARDSLKPSTTDWGQVHFRVHLTHSHSQKRQYAMMNALLDFGSGDDLYFESIFYYFALVNIKNHGFHHASLI